MLIYEKKVDGTRHLFGNYSGNVPTADDRQLKYVDADGDEEIIVAKDTYKCGPKGTIYRVSDGKPVIVQIYDTTSASYKTVIGDEPEEKTVKSIKVKKATKTSYEVGDTLDLTGMEVKEVYTDGDEKVITEGFTTSPVDGATLAVTDTKVTVTHTASTKTASFNITVIDPSPSE